MLQGLEQANIIINYSEKEATVTKWVKIWVNSQIVPLFCSTEEIIQIMAGIGHEREEKEEIWAITNEEADITTKY